MVTDFNTLYDLPREISRILEEAAKPISISQRRSSYPLINVSEDETHYFIDAKLPGMSLGDIDLTLTDKSLVIKGKRVPEPGNYYRQERGVGVFQRIVGVGAPVDRDGVQASYRDGILEVSLRKAESTLPKKIAVEA